MRKRTKRKVKKFFAKHELILFGMLVVGALFSVTGAYAILNSEVSTTGTSTITGEFASSGGTCPYEMTYERVHGWGNTTVVNINLTNVSSYQWKSYMMTLDNITSVTNFFGPFRSVTTTSDGNTYVLFPDAYKMPLEAGATQTFQVQIETKENYEDIIKTLDVPNCGQDNPNGELIMNGGAYIHLNTYEKELPTSIVLDRPNQWDGQHYKVSITNNTNKDIYDWRLVVYFGAAEYYATYGHTGIELKVEESRLLGNGTTTLRAGSTIEFYLVLKTDVNYLPDIIGAGSQP